MGRRNPIGSISVLITSRAPTTFFLFSRCHLLTWEEWVANFSRLRWKDSNPAVSLSNSRTTKPTTFPDQGISPSLILFVHSSNFRLSPSILVAIITCSHSGDEKGGGEKEKNRKNFRSRRRNSFVRPASEKKGQRGPALRNQVGWKEQSGRREQFRVEERHFAGTNGKT